MNRQVRVGQQSKRVADYFAVVGVDYGGNRRKSMSGGAEVVVKDIDSLLQSVDSPEFEELVTKSRSASSPASPSSNDESFVPDIIDKYPFKDYHDFPFPEVSLFLLLLFPRLLVIIITSSLYREFLYFAFRKA
jgi:hypothetical protein